MYSKVLFIFLVVYLLPDFSYGERQLETIRADYNYIEAVQNYYKFHTTSKNWHESKRVCAQEGARLFYPEDRDEANAVISLWKLYQNYTPPNDTWVYVGITDLIAEGEFETIDGKPINEVYNHWKVSQPDNSGDEDCLHLNQDGELNDIKCNAEYSFICKITPPPLQQSCSCNSQKSNLDEQKDEKLFRKDYTYIESEKSFYKVHTIAKTFADAKRMCALEGASLFYAENVDEATAVISFWNRTQPNIPWVYVGLTDIMAEGVFETVDRRPITEVYSKWYKFQPDNTDGKENCVHMDLQRTMNDYRCDSKSNFICKKSLQSLKWHFNCSLPKLDGQRQRETIRADYNYIEAVQNYYKFHTTSKNWHESKRVCAQEGARLFYPEDRDEANAVISLWKLYQNHTPPNDTWVYVGITDLIAEGEFETIDGKSINEVYNHWKVNQPDNSSDEDCLHLNQDGELNDIKCNAEYSFICKITPPPLQQSCSCSSQKSNLDEQKKEKIFRKDYTYIESEMSFYKVHTTAKTFADAERMCAFEGASLFYAENVDEANAVISFWNRTQPNIPWVYVGLTDIMAEGVFETVDRRLITEVYSKWHKFQPDNSGGKENCVHMDLQRTMNDYRCDSKSNFICKKSLHTLEWNCNCSMPNLDYVFNRDIGKCYKIHTTPLNWADAYAMCRAEYTSLAVINNRIEADYLAQLVKSMPRPRINQKYQRGIYHLGFHNRFNEGWQTVGGTPMSIDADTWFDHYQPDGNLHEECGSMFFNGRLINTDCNMKSMFICEHDVESSNSFNEAVENTY